MKKLITTLGIFLLAFGFTAGVHSATLTIDFDDLEANGQYIGEQYASLGVHFIVHPGGFGIDGHVVDGPETAHSGDNYLYFSGNSSIGESGGVFIMFDSPVTEASWHWEWLTAVYGAWVGNWDGVSPYTDIDFEALQNPIYNPYPWVWWEFGPATHSSGSFNVLMIGPPSGGTGALDTLVITMIPIPASLLLLGTGLVPLFRLRKRRG